MMKAMDCADYIVDQALQNKWQITNLQLQKILFVLVAEYIRKNNNYPLDNNFKAYDYGPVIPQVYAEYSDYGSDPIKSVSDHEEFNLDNFEFEAHTYDKKNISSEFKKLVKTYLKDLLNINIFDIVEYTHSLPLWEKNEEDIHNHEPIYYSEKDVRLNDKLGNLIKKKFK